MKNAGKARSYGLYRHLRTSKEIIENLLNYSGKIYVFSLKNIRYNIKWKAISFDKSGGSHYNENV